MPISHVEKTGCRVPSLAPEASLQLFAERRERRRLRELDAFVSTLTRRILDLDAAHFDATLDALLETLGRCLEADRVFFHAAEDTGDQGFRACRVWTAESGVAAADAPTRPFDLVGLGDDAATLVAGHALCRTASRRTTPSPGWARVRASLLVPCPSRDGLAGLLVIEAGLAASRWSDAVVERAEVIARIFASGLDRLHLAGELDAVLSRQGHEARLETLGRVASAVAHDFNNVLTAILGYADLLEIELDESGHGRDELGEIRQAANRAAGLVDQVLAFGRTRRTGVEAIELGETLEGLGGMLRQVLGESILLELDWARPEQAGRVVLDPGRLGPVVMNLASNARGALADRDGDARFTLSTRRVQIAADGVDPDDRSLPPTPITGLCAGEYMRLTAADNGCGIEPALVDRIFEPFFTTKAAGLGTGLGLASTAEFVQQAQGGLRLETAPGEGAAFHLYFPIVPEARATDAAEPDVRPPSDPTAIRV